MTVMTSRAVLDAVTADRLSPEEGAELLRVQREEVRRPSWIPAALFAVGVVLLAVFFSPVLSATRENRS
jgi:hypothetical protein